MRPYSAISRFSLVAVIVLLAGCASSPGNLAEPPTELSAGDFHLYAQITVRQKTAKRFYINWQRQNAGDEVKVQSPFGDTRARITRNVNGASLEVGGKRTTEKDATVLSQQILGYALPIKSFGYWIVGVSSPHSPAEVLYNADGVVMEITQDGWRIDYQDRYANNLPKSLTANQINQSAMIEINIKRWLMP